MLNRSFISLIGLSVALTVPNLSYAQSTKAPAMATETSSAKTVLNSEYVMTVRVNLLVRPVTDTLRVIEVTSGQVNGPKIKGRVVAPSGDWLRVLPSGVAELDVRILIETDDGALIYGSYKGVLKASPESNERLNKGELLKTDELYLMGAPKFETKAPNYAWLNEIQTVSKMVEFQRVGDPHFTYDVFAVR